MKIVLVTTLGNKIIPSGIVSAVLTQTAEVACDSLSIKIIGGKSLDEIERVYVYKNNKLIFNGYCDCQRTTADERGFETYIYARSSACLLVDNDAFAYTYNRPSAQSLFDAYAKSFGFSYKLDDICTFKKYEVSSGSSLYGAINLLVSTITGNSIRINADNEIFMLKPSENILSLNDFSVISAKSIINRSEPISAVNYKKEFSYLYDCHTYSQLAEKLGFSRQRYVNLAALPSWQRNYKISKMLKDSFKDYKRLEITLKGYVESELLQRFDYSGKLGDFNDYLLFEKVYSIDENAEHTKLILRKNIDISEVNYVD